VNKIAFRLVLAISLFTLLCAVCYADAPIQGELKEAPVLVPFRVWVLPYWENGSMVAGHYEYFEILMPKETMTLVSPQMAPVFPNP